ncbi:MAG: MFS transporter [Armatimonadota bacterium]|nr:MAG: MFS transporter [Armatimonadota bacterium]
MSHAPKINTAQEQDATEHTRWNFVVIVTESTFFMSALAWVDPSSVLPLFIGKLTPSTVIIGLIAVLQRLGWLLPPIFMAAVLGHRPRRLPWLRWPVLLGRLPFLAFVVYLWVRGVGSPATVIWFMVIAYACISLANGLLGISWQDIIAKSIPSWLRGRFFGAMQFATAVTAFGVGFVVRWMLGPRGPGFPQDYTVLFTLMGIFLTFSTIGCWMVREPVRPVLDRPQSVREILGSALPMLRRQAGFRALVLTAVLGFGISYAMPFYMVYAKERLGVQESIAGIYIWASTVGGAIASIWWGYLNDRRGPRAVVRGACVFITITPLLAIVLAPAVRIAAAAVPSLTDVLPYLFALVFLLGGSAIGATWMGATNYLFELASHQDRPRYIALLNLLTAPGALAPLLIGWLLNYLSFPVVFALMAVFGLAALIISLLMPAATEQSKSLPST